MEFIDLKAQQDRIRPLIETNINNVLTHGQYIMGPEVVQLEKQLSEYIGSSHCIANASGTDALLLALMSLSIQPGDEIITTPFSFFATCEVISLLKAVPVFVDIDERTYNIDPTQLESAITKKTKAIIPVNLYGLCADFDAINQIAEKYKIAVIEDAAQSFGAEYKGRRSGALSTISCTSFFPSKPLGCYGDGGACFTNNIEIAESIRRLRVHGQKKRYYHTEIGINGRIDTLQAAILLAKLSIFPDEVEQRHRIGEHYSNALKHKFQCQEIPAGYRSVYAQFTIEVDNREQFVNALKAQGIPTAVHYPTPLHLQPVYNNQTYYVGQFPISEKAAQRVVSLPMHPYLTETDQDKIIHSVLKCL